MLRAADGGYAGVKEGDLGAALAVLDAVASRAQAGQRPRLQGWRVRTELGLLTHLAQAGDGGVKGGRWTALPLCGSASER